KRRTCKVYASDLRVKVNKEKGADYVYPDVAALCEKGIFSEQDNLTNPTLIIEVLSSSTEKYDLGQKSELYRAIPSLQAYLLIAQDRCHIAYYQRQSQQTWLLREYNDNKAVIVLEAIKAKLCLSDIYDKVVFSEETDDTL
ncbi:MAG: Uma2 family endonuclease, partial [Methylococcales bacterium]|nr:Uma2 family endonuclease [Methylococcales bacterium]